MTSKTPAQRKADERARRRDAGQVMVQEWVYRESVRRLRLYAKKLRKESGKGKPNAASE